MQPAKNKTEALNAKLRTTRRKCILTDALQQGLKFGLLSAYLPHNSEPANMALHQQLKKEIAELGYAPVEVNVGYAFTYKAVTEKYAEWCLLVPGITFYRLIKTGAAYRQASVIFSDYDCFNLIQSNTGLVLGNYGRHAGKLAFTQTDTHEILKQFLISRFGAGITPAVSFIRYPKHRMHTTNTFQKLKTINKWQHYDLAI